MTASQPLVLSIFPGIDLLGMAFEAEGFCVVRGPDLLWGGDIRAFHPRAGRFDGVIGGPPCQAWSPLANVARAVHGPDSVAPDLIPEYERVVGEARPEWFVMENVPRAPLPSVDGYGITDRVIENRWYGADQSRKRRFSFGLRGYANLSAQLKFRPEVSQVALESSTREPAVTTSSGGRRAVIAYDGNGRVRGKQGHADHARLRGRSFARECELQGLPLDFLADSPFTASGKREAVGNGVPLPMGRAIAKAVKAALALGEAVA